MKNPEITITMEDGGVIRAELYPEVAPNTVKNFISLAGKGYYDGLIFHRVIKGFMIQGGCRTATAWAARVTPSRVSSARTVSRMI